MKQLGMFVVITLLALAMVAPPISAQSQPLIVATGVPEGTYAQFFNDIVKVCPQPRLQGAPSQGSVENLERVMNNQANLAFVQADVLFAKKYVEHDPAVEVVRSYLVLYLEEIHILTLASNTSIAKFSDLANKKVGIYGGSTITAQFLYYNTDVKWAGTQTYPGPKEAVDALSNGSIDAILGIGGKPLPWVQALDAKYKLVPFDLMNDKLKNIYLPAALDYSNFNQPGGVRTIGIPSMLVTRDYSIPTMVKPLTQLRDCILKNLKALQQTTGFHPKWSQVSPENKINWPTFGETKP